MLCEIPASHNHQQTNQGAGGLLNHPLEKSAPVKLDHLKGIEIQKINSVSNHHLEKRPNPILIGVGTKLRYLPARWINRPTPSVLGAFGILW